MIDPINMTDYNRSILQLEETMLFCIAAAGKNALTSARILDEFLHKHGKGTIRPFEIIRKFKPNVLLNKMKKAGFGCYTLKSKGFHYIARQGLDLRTCTWEDLDACPGVGMKTAKFFVLHTRKDANVACLDTHILKWFRDLGYKNVPKSSPQSEKVYKKFEDIFLSLALEHKMSPADLDLSIWNKYRVKKQAA